MWCVNMKRFVGAHSRSMTGVMSRGMTAVVSRHSRNKAMPNYPALLQALHSALFRTC